jgi:hypothetical protein
MSRDAFLPILAANFPWQEVIGVIFMILYGLAQLLGGRQQAKRRAQRQRPALPRDEVVLGAPPAAGQPQQPATIEEALRREVEEFLRRAQGDRPRAPVKPAPTASAPPARPQSGKQRRQGKPAASQPAQPPVRRIAEPAVPLSRKAAEPTGAAPRRTPLGSGVTEHVALQTAEVATIARHATQLGETVAQADDKLAEHLRDKFVHQVGTLEHRDEAQKVQRTSTASPVAKQLFEMLSKPGGAKQLVIASEILRSPLERGR